MSEEKSNLWKMAAMQSAAGGSAGFIEICLMHPLDLIKTRLQIQKSGGSASDPHHYTSIVDCIRKMYRNEGFLSYWKGILPPIIVETPKRAVKFLAFEQYKNIFMFGSPTPILPLTYALSGLGAGFTEAVLVNPFEVIKVEMQANKQVASQMPSTIVFTKHIIRTQGPWALYKGLVATMGRHGAFTSVYFGFYHSVKTVVPEVKDSRLELMRRFIIGLMAGVFGACLAVPFDVAKSRIQGPQPVPGEVKYRGTIRTFRLLLHEEGISALFKGLIPILLRLGPGGAVLLIAYEYCYEFLKKQFPDRKQ